MKKLIVSLLTLVLVVGVSVYGTVAYFTDTEQSTGNTFTTGTIEMAVDGQSIWDETYTLDDMKPSYTDYIDFVVYNEGTNPFNLYKTLQNFSTEDIECTEPEEEAGGCDISNVHDWVNYDMRVELYDEDPEANPQAEPVWWETIYMDEDDVKMGSLLNQKMYLGMVPVGYYMKVMQSYHMVSEADNRYQADRLTFDIMLEAMQLTNTVVLEDKYEADTDVSHHVWNSGGISNGKDASFEYKVMDRELAYTLTVNGMAPGTYSLIAWEGDVWNWSNRGDAKKIADVTVSGDPEVLSGSVNIGNLTNAKVWLIPGTYVEGDASTFPWAPLQTLFETGLMDYYDADL